MIVFIDIETVPQYAKLEELPTHLLAHWNKKCNYLRLTDEQKLNENVAYLNHAGIYAEFGKVICIGLGYYQPNTKELKTTVLTHNSEVKLLQQFKQMLQQISAITSIEFCGHNIKEFDLPFLCKRMMIQRIQLPKELDLAGLKPWENNNIDTMQLWRFGEYKRFTSLDLIASVLNISSSKTEMDGSKVAKVYYEENDIEKIANYCLDDVVTTARVYYRLSKNENKDFTVVKNYVKIN